MRSIFLRPYPANLSLGLLALMVSGPFLLPFHSDPIASFWNEWWAGALGLCAAVCGLLVFRNRLGSGTLPFPQLLFIPGLLLAVLLMQFAIGRLVFPQVGTHYAIYLLWAGLLLVLGRHLADTIGLARIADVLALAFTLGALVGTAMALLQWLGIADGMPWIFSENGSVYANLGQSNHHAHYSWLGIASAFYLRGWGNLSRGLLWLLVLFVGFGSVISGSRSVFIYPLVLLAALAWARYRDPQGPAAKLVADAALLLPALIALNFFGVWVSPRLPEFLAWLRSSFPLLDFSGYAVRDSRAVMSGARLYESVSGSSERLAIARAAWSAFVEHPWLGQGAGNYPAASFAAAAGHTGEEQFRVAEHAHNFVLQMLAEFGAPVTVAVILLLLCWAKRFLHQTWQPEHVWCGSMLGMGAVHSLLEYPLWYSYFLGPTALLLGAAGSGKTFALTGRRIAVYLVLVALAGAVILGNLRSDYSKIEAASYHPLAADPDRERAWRISMGNLLMVYRDSLLSPWALLAFTNLAEPSRQLARERADLCERGIRFAPARLLVTRCAIHMAIAGRDADAKRLVLEVLRAFPDDRNATSQELAKAALKFPEIEPLRVLSRP